MKSDTPSATARLVAPGLRLLHQVSMTKLRDHNWSENTGDFLLGAALQELAGLPGHCSLGTTEDVGVYEHPRTRRNGVQDLCSKASASMPIRFKAGFGSSPFIARIQLQFAAAWASSASRLSN